MNQRQLDQLTSQIAVDPGDETRWKVYADALIELGELPDFFRHALEGNEVPSWEFVSDFEHQIRDGELQLRFNKFHFLEQMWVRPHSWDGDSVRLFLTQLLSTPVAQFIQAICSCPCQIGQTCWGVFSEIVN